MNTGCVSAISWSLFYTELRRKTDRLLNKTGCSPIWKKSTYYVGCLSHTSYSRWLTVCVCVRAHVCVCACVCYGQSCLNLCDTMNSSQLWTGAFVCSWDFTGKNTGEGCHCLLQRMQPTSPASAAMVVGFTSALQNTPAAANFAS